MAIVGDLAQTFFIDSEAVNKSSYAFLTSLDLYFKTVPTAGSTSSNLPRPGVTIFICETKNNNNVAVPDLDNMVRYGRARVEYGSINASLTSSTATTFTFNVPVPVKTNTSYAVVIKFDGSDSKFSLWRNKANEVTNSTPRPAVTKGALDGYFFVLTNGVNAAPQSDVDLKFALRVGKFDTTTSYTYNVVNRNYEFACVNMPTKDGTGFIPGEIAFIDTGEPAGQTVSVSAQSNVVVGTDTTFLTDYAANSHFIIRHGSRHHEVRKITRVANNTHLYLDAVPKKTNTASKYIKAAIGVVHDWRPENNILTLKASTANTTHTFHANTTSNTIIGVSSNTGVELASLMNYKIKEYLPRFGIVTPTGTTANTFVKLANTSGNTVATPYRIDNSQKALHTDFNAHVFSRSDEAAFGAGLTNNKSVNFDLVFSSNNEFVTPYVDEEDLNFFGYGHGINNSTRNEHTNYGDAKSRYVSRRINLNYGQLAEDIRVYLSAYRPYGSEVHVYAKFYNQLDPEAFTSKNWTKLENIVTQSLFSSAENPNDYVDLEFKLPNFPLYEDAEEGTINSGTVLTSSFQGQDANSTFLAANASANIESQVVSSDLVRIYDPLFPNNSLIAVVTSSNATSFTIDSLLDSANTRLSGFIASGLTVEKVEYKNTAFNNYLGNTVIRYYNSTMAAFDSYDSFALKIVLTTEDNNTHSPAVDNIRAIALSA